jgi:hypothetical protein
VILLVSYPFFGDNPTGAALGGLTSLLVLGAGVYALRACRKSRIVVGVLALCAFVASVVSLLGQVRGSMYSEICFSAYYAVTTVAVFAEVIRLRRFNMDAILGAVSVYLLIGVAFGSFFDLLETIEPGSFRLHDTLAVEATLGFRRLLFFSFMTLTSVGYGDITPVTDLAQSLSILEGVAGVLYVAVLVGGVVNAYRQEESRSGNGQRE